MHTYFHVTYPKKYNSFPNFEINTQINVGDKNNPFFNYYYETNDFVHVNTDTGVQNVHYATHLRYLASSENDEGYPEAETIIPYLNHKIMDHINLNCELLLENIRLQYYPHLPSRMKCLWVTSNIDECNIWFKFLLENEEMQLVTLESKDEAHKVDGNLLPLFEDSLAERERKAHAYWSGEMSESPMIEYLFVGTATIKGIREL